MGEERIDSPDNKKEKVTVVLDDIVREAYIEMDKKIEEFIKSSMIVKKFLWFKFYRFQCQVCKEYFPRKRISLIQHFPTKVKEEKGLLYLKERVSLICKYCSKKEEE